MWKGDYYKSPGISRGTRAEDIKKAFRRLALRYHHDHNPSKIEEAEKRYKEINEAHVVLGDENKRRDYDHLLNWQSYPQETVIYDINPKDQTDLDLIKEMLQRFINSGSGFVSSECRMSWGCKRQYLWRRCRRWCQ